jgi:hypothetical protein
MSYEIYKDGKIYLDGVEFLANSISITTENSLSPDYIVTKRHPDNLYPSNGIKGNISLSYYLTGNDYLYNFVTNEQRGISVSSLGSNLVSMNVTGYLSSYNLALKPNNPLSVNANIVFFEEISGTASVSYSTYLVEPKILSTSDIIVDALQGFSEENITNIESVDFNYSCQINPNYTINTGALPYDTYPYNIRPSSVTYGEKQISANLVYDGYSQTANYTIPVTGKNMGVRVRYRHPEIPNFSGSFICSGKLTSKNIKTSVGDHILTSLSIVQYNVDEPPTITGFDPITSSPGSFVRISGRNFSNVSNVYFHDREAIRYTVINDTLISGIVPYDAITGKINVYTYGGMAQSSTNYLLSYPPINIKYVSQYTGFSGQPVLISGDNFYRISHVFWGNESGTFRNINSGCVNAYIPGYAKSGILKVVSTGRNLFANAPHGYVPVPFITGFEHWSGMSGDIVRVSGFGFSGINTFKFNNINAMSFDVISNELMTGVVPSGNINGYIYLRGTSGVACLSRDKFRSSLFISGINPLSGSAGDIVEISGYNFQTGILYQLSGGFKVKFNNSLSIFQIHNNRLLTGKAPAGFTAGPIYLYDPDNVVYYNTGFWGRKNATPTITSFSPSYAVSGYRYDGYIEGTELFNVTGLRFIGTDGTSTSDQNAGRTYIIPMINDIGERVLRSDSLGLRLNITNYTGFVFPTGVASHPAKATGRFDLYLYTTQYSTSYTSTKLLIESAPRL